MATATEISTKALKRLALINPGETPDAFDIADANAALNEIIAAWDATWKSGVTLPLSSRFDPGLVAVLAVRLAGDYGKVPGNILMRDAMRGEAQIRAAFMPTADAEFDATLVLMPGTRFTPYQQTVPNPAPDWAASTVYDLYQVVINVGNLYECSTAGTSAASGGPTGQDSAITDGTVVWIWRRAEA